MKTLQLMWANGKTSIPGIIFVICFYLALNPSALTGLMPANVAHSIVGWAGLVTGIYSFATSKANTVSGNGSIMNATKVAQSDGTQKVVNMVIVCALIPSLFLSGCAQVAAFQNNPVTQAVETEAISIGTTLATGSPSFAYLAPVAVSGLTALIDGSNPTAVTGSLANDIPLITSTIAAAIPNSAGKTAATAIAQTYSAAMSAPNAPPPNAILSAIASGLTQGATKVPAAN